VTVETRYMRGDKQTVNGLSAYILGTSQSAVSGHYSVPVDTGYYWGIRVWKRASDGTETEITSGTPVAQVARSSGAGLQSATWDCPLTSLVGSDAVVVRVYERTGGATTWTLCAEFITEQLGGQSLDAATWTVYYYTAVTAYAAVFWWGTSTYNSRIVNFTWTPVPVIAVQPLGEGLTFAP